MRTKEYKQYIKSQEWFEMKLDLIHLRGSKCEKCGKLKQPQKLQLHHKTYVRLFNELPQDLALLCAVCHQLEHGLKIKTKKLKKKVELKKPIAPKSPNRTPIQKLIDKYNRGGYKSLKGFNAALNSLNRKSRKKAQRKK